MLVIKIYVSKTKFKLTNNKMKVKLTNIIKNKSLQTTYFYFHTHYQSIRITAKLPI